MFTVVALSSDPQSRILESKVLAKHDRIEIAEESCDRWFDYLVDAKYVKVFGTDGSLFYERKRS
jgi:hypothetical protein